MARVRVPAEDRTIESTTEIASYLDGIGIEYERWEASEPVSQGASSEAILEAYSRQIDELKSREGYVTADVIDVTQSTPGLNEMLAKFSKEHWHDDDEVRFIIEGRGVFHIHPPDLPVVAIEVESGDLIRVPKDTLHWFDLCSDRRIRAIRLFKDQSGWTPRYTESLTEKAYEPVCLGHEYIPLGTAI
ncbi:MAG: acireductone dioxygenase [Blastocatellia bacterium AA13]|nr:MAG: acireductone dioxygenase [Blastocatellia bacterium AA13]